MSAFNRIHSQHGDMVGVFKNINPSAIKVDNDGESVWIYSMRQSDALPKTTQDMERVFAFVRMFMEQYLDQDSCDYVTKHINIAVCFFIWFFSTPNFFFNKKVVKQTTRGGITKIWRSILLIKPPIQITNTVTQHKRGVNHQSNILSNLEKDREAIQENILSLIQSVHSDFTIQWDKYDYHTKISETMQYNHKHYIHGKKSKKIQKLYQEFQKLNEKIILSKKSISNVEQKSTPLTIQVPQHNITTYDWGECGSPPSPPKLIRSNAVCIGSEYTSLFDSTPIVNDMVSNDEIPESWEDL
tara:strand:+ start:1087 stop:1983 length:897 start_codon:yes stop_codon:yes gene_type:complete